MASRKSKRAKRFKARQHQTDSRNRTRTVAYPDGTEVEVRGTTIGQTPSFHKTDPPRHGHRLDAAGQTDRILRQFIPEDTEIDEQLRSEFRRLSRVMGGSHYAGLHLKKLMNEAVPAKPSGKRKTLTDHGTMGTSAEDGMSYLKEMRSDPGVVEVIETIKAPISSGDTESMPVDMDHLGENPCADPALLDRGRMIREPEWDEHVAAAKKRKKGIQKYLEPKGYRLVSETADPKSRLSWIRGSESAQEQPSGGEGRG